MTYRRTRAPEKMTTLPYPNKRCPKCDYCTDALSYYGEPGTAGNYLICIDERTIENRRNPMCGYPTNDGFGCNRWEST